MILCVYVCTYVYMYVHVIMDASDLLQAFSSIGGVDNCY